MIFCEVKLDNRTCCTLDYSHCKITVQPAGSDGQRRVFLTLLSGTDENGSQQMEFLISAQIAQDLGEALISGSLGVLREFELEAPASR
jgi:hypothetical protein